MMILPCGDHSVMGSSNVRVTASPLNVAQTTSGSDPSCSNSIPCPSICTSVARGNVTGIGTSQVLLLAVTITLVMEAASSDKV